MNKFGTSVKSVVVAAVLAAVASASATAGEATTPTGFATVARIPVTALSTSEMAETRGARVRVGHVTVYTYQGFGVACGW
jgi:hypothetical protein